MNTLERLERANPVPDDDRLLSAPGALDAFVLSVMQRSGIVRDVGKTTVEEEDRAPIQVPRDVSPPERPTTRSKRRLRLGAAAAAAVVVAAIGMTAWLVGGDSSEDVVQGGGPDLIKVVEDMYAADTVDATLIHLALDGSPGEFREIYSVSQRIYTMPDVRERLSVIFALNTQTALSDCRLFDNDTAVECTVRHRDDLHSPAGLDSESQRTFRFNETGLITDAASIGGSYQSYDAMDRAFMSWLQVEHPEIHAEVSDPFGLVPTEDAIEAFMPFVEEFVAETPDYPVSE